MRHVAHLHRKAGAALGTLAIAACASLLAPSTARGEPITYQGTLNSLGEPIVGPIDVRARLFDAAVDGTQVGPTVNANIETDPAGLFTVPLDFGPTAFRAGERRWLQFEIASPAGSGDFTLLNPRQSVDAAPLAQGILGVALTPAGGPALDQSQDAEASVGTFSESIWQSFTAGVTGSLVAVEFQVRNLGTPPVVGVRVRRGVGLDGPIIGTGSITYAPLPDNEFKRIVSIPLPSVPVFASERYTFEITGNSAIRRTVSAIPGAQGSSSNSPTSLWFRTYVATIARANLGVATSDFAGLAAFARNAETANVAQSAVAAQSAQTAQSAQLADTASNVPWLGLTGQGEVRTGSIGTGWQLLFTNSAQSSFRGGMRLNDSGFFDVTNNANATSPGFARLSSAGTWSAVSDARLKQDVSPLDANDQLARVLRLRPVSFAWIDTGERDVGLVAQEVRKVMPEFVVGDEASDLLTVNYSHLSVAAIAAIQAMEEKHQKERSALEAKIEALTERLEALEVREEKP